MADVVVMETPAELASEARRLLGEPMIKLLVPDELPADRDPRAVYLARLAPGSRITMGRALDDVAHELGAPRGARIAWWMLRYQHTNAVRARLAERFAPSTASKAICALRGVLLECARLGLMSREAMHNAADVAGVRGSRELAGRALSQGELRALFASCADGTRLGARDAAILALAYGCGLRRAELVALDLASIDGEGLRIVGKGNKERRVFFPAGTRAALDAWLRIRGEEPGPLVMPIRNGRILRRRCVPEVVFAAVRRRAAAAALQACSPHDLRRSVTGDLLDAGVDLVSVQGVLGHASINTTARYDRRGERARRGAADRVHVPFVGEK